ncbi:alpha/beta fold hydrolase [Caulobacter sp. NIBR1757]|uniref:alpha/beta fold hydrolase n=1 Tax=Caulobacter sp. NIBR1757 TaxID=3016000 RepID=UPI0022F06C36|nr:alpha/beta fold hydrolase [Caulobacter sp. NIBR1757]WGM40317.1 hypothetical protein AMEJIAPC_03261 [Caulobacter sp. NIBR1757]
MKRLIALFAALTLLVAPVTAAAASLSGVMAAAEKGDAATLLRDWKDPSVVEALKLIGPDAVIDYYVAVGKALDRLGRRKAAAQAYDLAIEEGRASRGPRHASLIEIHRLLGAAQFADGQYADAVWNLEEASSIATGALGPNDPLVAALDRTSAQYARTATARGVDLGGNGDIPPPPPPPPPGSPPAPARRVDDRKPFQKVTVYYATERRPTGSALPASFYGGKRGPMVFGKAVVSVPSRRQVGEIPTPSVFTLTLRADPEKHFILTSLAPISTREGFLGEVAGAVGRSREKEAFVFIHGFNSSFENGALRTAQLAADLKFDGAPILYSWPSRGDVFGYGDDARESESDREASTLADFLRDVATKTGAERITLIAHSMGNRPLLNALQKIAPPPAGAPPLFDEVVLAAPDVGVDDFDKAWPRVRQAGGRFTLYASSRDKALMFSAQINGMRRVGDARQLVLVDGLESIDTTAASNGLIGHDDFAGTALDDFRAVVWLSLAPDRRCVLQQGQGDRRWWAFGGACPVTDFRAATLAARAAGGAGAAITEVDQQMSRISGPAREAMDRMRQMLSGFEER